MIDTREEELIEYTKNRKYQEMSGQKISEDAGVENDDIEYQNETIPKQSQIMMKTK